MGAGNRVRIGLSYWPANLHTTQPGGNRFLGFDSWAPLKFKNSGSGKDKAAQNLNLFAHSPPPPPPRSRAQAWFQSRPTPGTTRTITAKKVTNSYAARLGLSTCLPVSWSTSQIFIHVCLLYLCFPAVYITQGMERVLIRVSSKRRNKNKFRFEPKQTETRSVSVVLRFVLWNQKQKVWFQRGAARPPPIAASLLLIYPQSFSSGPNSGRQGRLSFHWSKLHPT